MAKSEVIVTNVLLGIVVVVLVVIVVLCVTRKNEGFYKASCFNTAKNCKDLKECCKKNPHGDQGCGLWISKKEISASNLKQHYVKEALDSIGRFSYTMGLKNDKDNWGKKCKYE